MRWCSRGSGCVQPGHARVSGRSDRCSCRCSVWLRPAVRASGRLSRPKGAVRCHKPGGGGSTWTWTRISDAVAVLLHPVRLPFSNRACHSPPCACRADVGPLVRDRARAFPAQVKGPSRAAPHHLSLLQRIRLKFEVLELRGAGANEMRAQTSARLQVLRPRLYI